MAGGDQSPRQAKTKQRMADDPDLHWKALLRHYRLTKPLIAAVEGYAIAGGTEILQACEIRVAAEGATFGIAEVRRGLFPLGGSTVRLRRQIPETIAAELLLTGRFVPAAEAKEIGLIGHVVPKGEALNKALEIAAQISANGPLAVQAVLRSLRETEGLSEVDGLARELEIGQPIFGTYDSAGEEDRWTSRSQDRAGSGSPSDFRTQGRGSFARFGARSHAAGGDRGRSSLCRRRG